MSALATIRLKGFRGLYGYVEFGPGLNIVIGPNCAGKTIVLEAAAYLLALSYTNLQEAHGYLALLHAARGSPIHSMASLVADEGIIEGTVYHDNKPENVLVHISKRVSYESVGPTLQPVVNIDFDSAPRRCKLKYKLVEGRPSVISFSKECLHNEGFRIAVVTPGIYPYDFFDQLVGRAKRSQDRVWNVLSQGIQLDGTHYSMDVASDEWGKLAAFVRENEEFVSFYTVGRGLQRALIMLASLEYADIVLVDEIESAMHPKLLAQAADHIARAVLSKEKTVIVTTQSLEAARFLAAAYMGAPTDTWTNPIKLAEHLEATSVDKRFSLVVLERKGRELKSLTLHGHKALEEIVYGEDVRLLYTLVR